MWGKIVKKTPLVTAAATMAAGREAIVQDVAGVITEGGIEAEQGQTLFQLPERSRPIPAKGPAPSSNTSLTLSTPSPVRPSS